MRHTPGALLGASAGSFGAKTDFLAGTNPRCVAIGDFNGDGKVYEYANQDADPGGQVRRR